MSDAVLAIVDFVFVTILKFDVQPTNALLGFVKFYYIMGFFVDIITVFF